MSGHFSSEAQGNLHPGTGPWTVQFAGIPTQFTWRDLKDEIREEASHVGHVEILPNRTARIALRKWDEACKCFKYLASHGLGGTELYVELWETAATREPPRRIYTSAEWKSSTASTRARQSALSADCLPPPARPSIPTMQPQQDYPTQSIRQALPPEYALAYRSHHAAQPARQQSAHRSIPTLMSTPAHTPLPTRSNEPREVRYMSTGVPVSSRTSGYAGHPGIPTNINQGAVRTEYRGVFVSNLSYDVQDRNLHDLCRPFGEITKIVHKREDKVNAKGKVVSRSKGSAIITFSSSQDAGRAIACLNGRSWNDRVLALRFDTEGTPVNVPPVPQRSSSLAKKNKRCGNDGTPLIVDGSKYSKEPED